MLIYSTFKSIQGEVNAWHQGRVAVFVRLPYCNLRCRYCDTMYAVEPDKSKLKEYTPEELFSFLNREYSPYEFVTITGGEPLLQADEVREFTKLLLKHSKRVVIETNGSFDFIDDIHNENVSWVFDYKLSGSGERDAMINDWFPKLTNNDFVKFVISVDSDFDEAVEVIDEIKRVNPDFENFAISPAFDPKQESLMMGWLAEKVTQADYDGNLILNLQIHKLIWRDNDGSEH